MHLSDIWNRFLLSNPDIADSIEYEYDGTGMITKEIRYISTRSGVVSVTKKVTITYTRDGSGNITKKTVVITTE